MNYSSLQFEQNKCAICKIIIAKLNETHWAFKIPLIIIMVVLTIIFPELFLTAVVVFTILESSHYLDTESIHLKNSENKDIVLNDKNNLFIENITNILEKENGKYLELLNSIENYKQRLNNHLVALVKNRNLNLIIGLVITVVSISLLLKFFILGHEPKQTEDLVFYYASRFIVVISTEVFSLFFLKLYSANLAEVKYFQNELSNVESKIIALKTAMLVEQPELIAEVVKELVKTERNYILKKDETTVDLERTKLDKEDNKHLLDSLLQTIKDLKSK